MLKKNLLLSLLAITFFISSCEQNKKPTGSLQLEKKEVFPEEEILVQALVSDENGDSLTYDWSVDGGELKLYKRQDTIWWTAPATAGDYSIGLTVTDGFNEIALSKDLTVYPVDYYDQYNAVGSNVGQNNLNADFVDSKVFMQVDFGSIQEYGSLITQLEDGQVQFNTVDLKCGYEMYNNGYVTFDFYFEVDKTYTGGQLEALKFEVDPLSTSYNWTIKYKWKDYSTGNYYWEFLDESSVGLADVIGTEDYNMSFHDVRFERGTNNSLSFYYDNQLIYTSTSIADMIANKGVVFDPTLNRIRYYVYYDAYMEVDYLYIY